VSTVRKPPAADPRRAPPVAERPLSIAFVISQFPPSVGGAEMRALRDARALRARGHEVRVVTVRWHAALPPADVVDGVPVRRVGGLYKRGALRFRFGMRYVMEARLCWELLRTALTSDLIHVRQFVLVPRAAGLAALLARKPVLARLGNVDPPPDFTTRVGAETRLYAGDLDPALPCLAVPADTWGAGDFTAFRRFHRFPDLWLRLFRRRGVMFAATSARMRAYLLENGFPADDIALLPNGIDSGAYADAAARVAARAAAGEVRAPTVVCVARLHYEKGHDLLLHAWQRVHASLPAARLVLVGDGPLRPQLEGLAAALGLGESVEFAGKAADPRVHLAGADLYVLPSRWEGST
jgi:glycosyltransferase involved in cell wall biosynthesis